VYILTRHGLHLAPRDGGLKRSPDAALSPPTAALRLRHTAHPSAGLPKHGTEWPPQSEAESQERYFAYLDLYAPSLQ